MEKAGKETDTKTSEPFNWKKLLIQFGIMLVILVVLFLGLHIFLSGYTHHGESLTVPNFKGKTLKEVEEVCKEKNLRYKIKDTVYNPDYARNTIADQNPISGAKVKEGRRIYISLNGLKAPMAEIPDQVINTSRKNAEVQLENIGLKVSPKVEYAPDDALNNVLRIKFQGRVLQTGQKLPMGSTVTLVLGDGGMSGRMPIPDLVGMEFEAAVLSLRERNLNFGNITSDAGKALVLPPGEYKIYKQSPPASEDEQIAVGEAINVWVVSPNDYDDLVKQQNWKKEKEKEVKAREKDKKAKTDKKNDKKKKP